MPLGMSECSTVVVGRRASETGEVIVAHNEDDHGRALVEQHWVPSFRHACSRRFEPWLPEVERAPGTHAFYWSQTLVRGGASFSNLVLNDRGVLIVSNACRGIFEDSPGGEPGALGFGLRMELAERASSAREAVDVAAGLLARYGYSDSGRTYTIADASEAWLLAVIQGRGWAARRVQDDEVAYISNCFTLTGLDLEDRDNVIVSPGLVERCAAAGRCSADARVFMFREAVQPAERRSEPYNFERTRIGWKELCGIDVANPELAPCCARPARKIGIGGIKALLRQPGPGDGERENWLHGPGYGISRPGTHDATIVRMSALPLLTEGWKALARPDETVFVPFFPLAGPARAAEGRGWREAFDGHFTAGPEALNCVPGTSFWSFTMLANAAEVLPAVWGRQHAVFLSLEGRLDRWMATLKRRAEKELPDAPERARALLHHGNEKCLRAASGVARRIFRTRLRRKISINRKVISASGTGAAEITLFSGWLFDAGNVDPGSVRAGPMRGSVPDDIRLSDLAVPVHAASVPSGGRARMIFRFRESDLARWLIPGGTYDLWLYGKAGGIPFAAVTMVAVAD